MLMSAAMTAETPKRTQRPCNHILIEVLNRQWCVRRYDDNGCGGFWYRRNPNAPWISQDRRDNPSLAARPNRLDIQSHQAPRKPTQQRE